TPLLVERPVEGQHAPRRSMASPEGGLTAFDRGDKGDRSNTVVATACSGNKPAACGPNRPSNGFLNRVSQVRFLPGARIAVQSPAPPAWCASPPGGHRPVAITGWCASPPGG